MATARSEGTRRNDVQAAAAEHPNALAEIDCLWNAVGNCYRTCGRAGCHCQGDGPKPWSASECELPRGMKLGNDHRLLCSQRSRGGHAQKAVAAWQQMQQCLRELAELNKERNLQRAREADSELQTMVPSNPGLLHTAGSVPQLCSGSRPEPRLANCRLATRVRSRAENPPPTHPQFRLSPA